MDFELERKVANSARKESRVAVVDVILHVDQYLQLQLRICEKKIFYNTVLISKYSFLQNRRNIFFTFMYSIREQRFHQ